MGWHVSIWTPKISREHATMPETYTDIFLFRAYLVIVLKT